MKQSAWRKLGKMTEGLGIVTIAAALLAGFPGSSFGPLAAEEPGTEDFAEALALVSALKGDEEGKGAYLGVQISEETEHPEGGARVEKVVEDSPAAVGGIQEGDIIVGFRGEVIRGPVALTERIHASEPGERVSITVIRDGQRETLEVELGERRDLWKGWRWEPDPGWQDRMQERWQEWAERFKEEDWSRHIPRFERWRWSFQRPKLGVQLVETTPELRQHLGGSEDAGVLVSKVLSNTPAARSGLKVGDLILSVNGENVSTPGELIEALSDKAGETIELDVVRNGKKLKIKAEIAEPEEEEASGPRAMLMIPPMPEPVPVPPVPVGPEIAEEIRRQIEASLREAGLQLKEAERQLREALTDTEAHEAARREAHEARRAARDAHREALRQALEAYRSGLDEQRAAMKEQREARRELRRHLRSIQREVIEAIRAGAMLV